MAVTLTWGDIHIAVSWTNHDGPLYDRPSAADGPSTGSLLGASARGIGGVSRAIRTAAHRRRSLNEACIRVAGYLTRTHNKRHARYRATGIKKCVSIRRAFGAATLRRHGEFLHSGSVGARYEALAVCANFCALGAN